MVAPSICVKNLLLNLVEFDVMVIPVASSMHSADGLLYFLFRGTNGGTIYLCKESIAKFC